MGAGGAPLETWTVLFVDVEGSGDLRAGAGDDDFERLRAEHARLVGAEADEHGARVVRSTEDGVMAGFAGTGAALRCATAIQRRFGHRSRGGGVPVGVSIGVSVGDAVLDGGGFRGRAVSEAAGLCAGAEAGRILCSVAVQAVVANRGSDEFGEARPVAVEGMADPVLACELAWEPQADEPVERPLAFRVLGPIEVIDAGSPIAVGGPKERLVLAHLLARANNTVSIDALVDGVWAGHPPRSAARTVHAYVARLRRALEPDRPRGGPRSVLVTAGRGYRLQLEPEQLDAARFRAVGPRWAPNSSDGMTRPRPPPCGRRWDCGGEAPTPSSASSMPVRPRPGGWVSSGSPPSRTGSTPTWPRGPPPEWWRRSRACSPRIRSGSGSGLS